jgi:hypothetical protein
MKNVYMLELDVLASETVNICALGTHMAGPLHVSQCVSFSFFFERGCSGEIQLIYSNGTWKKLSHNMYPNSFFSFLRGCSGKIQVIWYVEKNLSMAKKYEVFK